MAQFVTTPPSSLSDPTAVLQWRRSLIPANVGVSYASSPAGSLLLSSASGCYVTDSAGRRYLDCVNNVAHVGHSHPTVVQAAVQQLLAVNTNTVSTQSDTQHTHTHTIRHLPVSATAD